MKSWSNKILNANIVNSVIRCNGAYEYFLISGSLPRQ